MRALDLADPGMFPRALAGVRKVFLYAEPSTADEFAEAAMAAGVEHVVLLSSISVSDPHADKSLNALRHSTVERALEKSGLGWTFVRGGWFATNTSQWAQSIRTDGIARVVYPEAAMSPVHERDLAAVSVASLLEDKHNKTIYTPTGRESLTQREIIAQIADGIGKPVELQEISLDQARADMVRRFGSYALPEIIDDILGHLARAVGVTAEMTGDIERVTGRPARTFAQWVQDHKTDFTG
jgi:uncharacterized protein YbjT (DUF2867 family)